MGVYLIDVGVEEPTNYALGELRLSGQVLSSRSPLGDRDRAVRIAGRRPSGPSSCTCSTPAGTAAESGRSRRVDTRSRDGPQAIEFQLGSLEVGTHQGYVRIVGAGRLACDDKRYFTVEVKPAWRILVAAPQPADRYALFLAEVLAPAAFRRTGQARFECRRDRPWTSWPSEPLDDYAAVCLLDPDAAGAGRLAEAGRLRRRTATAWRSSWPQRRAGRLVQRRRWPRKLLPGKLLRQARRPDGDMYLAPRRLPAPDPGCVSRRLAGSIPWDAFPRVSLLAAGRARPRAFSVVVAYSDGRPALLERPLGNGRVVTHDHAGLRRPDREPGTCCRWARPGRS